MFLCGFLAAFCLSTCSGAAVALYQELSGVTLTFDHRGGSVNPGDQRFVESGRMEAAHQRGDHLWLRLRNDSDRVIALRTFSTYMKPPVQWLKPGDRSVAALQDGMEIALPFGVQNQRGTDLQFGSYGDMFWVAYLPPGRSVLFSVPPQALKRHRRVYVAYEDAVPPTHDYRVYFQLPTTK